MSISSHDFSGINLTIKGNYELPDPPLTELGFTTQCQKLQAALKAFPLAQDIDLIVVSPMQRTLQTATQGLAFLIDKGVPVILRAEWQENSAKPCDTGSGIAVMKEKWPQYDWSTVDPAYPAKEGLYEFSEKGLTARGIFCRKWLHQRPEKVIAVVSHAGFLRAGVSGRRYENADFRVFGFDDKDSAEGPKLVESSITEGAGGMGKSLTGTVGFTGDDYENFALHAASKEKTPQEIPTNSEALA